MTKNGGKDSSMTRNNAITFIYARKGLTGAGVGRPLGRGRFSRKPSAGLYEFSRSSVHTSPRGKNDTHVMIVP